MGPAVTQARVGIPQNFTVISRDKFRNLVLESSTYPTMLGVGPGGIIIRGSVREIGNGTYDIQFVPRKSGTYRMYVSLGCCVLHQVRFFFFTRCNFRFIDASIGTSINSC